MHSNYYSSRADYYGKFFTVWSVVYIYTEYNYAHGQLWSVVRLINISWNHKDNKASMEGPCSRILQSHMQLYEVTVSWVTWNDVPLMKDMHDV